MPKSPRYKTFLVAVVQRHEPHRTYAVVKQNSEEALAAINELSTEKIKAYLLGGLSRTMVRRMKLKRDDVRLI
jgi:hypothetical protein